MKVDALKAYLRQYGLPLAGAKYALVARCAAHARGDLRAGPPRTPPSAARRHTMVAQDAVEAKYLAMKIPQLQHYLRHNGQYVTGLKSELVMRCADGERLGALPKCPGCRPSRANVVKKVGGLFRCNGVWNGEGRDYCGWSDDQVKRIAWREPGVPLPPPTPPSQEELEARRQAQAEQKRANEIERAARLVRMEERMNEVRLQKQKRQEKQQQQQQLTQQQRQQNRIALQLMSSQPEQEQLRAFEQAVVATLANERSGTLTVSAIGSLFPKAWRPTAVGALGMFIETRPLLFHVTRRPGRNEEVFVRLTAASSAQAVGAQATAELAPAGGVRQQAQQVVAWAAKDPECTCFIHGLPDTMAAPAFWKKFWKEAGAAYGAVVPQCTNLIMDKATGKSKGYGFVQFTTKQAARELIARKRIDVMGSMCTVRIAHQKAKQQQPKQNGEPPMPKAAVAQPPAPLQSPLPQGPTPASATANATSHQPRHVRWEESEGEEGHDRWEEESEGEEGHDRWEEESEGEVDEEERERQERKRERREELRRYGAHRYDGYDSDYSYDGYEAYMDQLTNPYNPGFQWGWWHRD